MKLFLTIACCTLLLPGQAFPARLIVTVPPGITEVKLLSPGTLAVIDHFKGRLHDQLKAVRDLYQVSRLDSEVKEAYSHVADAQKAYADKIEALRRHYISKVSITIHTASAQITRESAMGDITFTYTVENNSDRIISDITYKPLIGNTALPITSTFVLEFINPANLIFGLAPGERITNAGHDPEHLSFFINELTEEDLRRIQTSMPKGLSLEITGIHFVAQKGYKGQTKVLDVKEAFAETLKTYQGASLRLQDEFKTKSEALSKAKGLYENATKGAMNAFYSSAKDLKESSVRYRAEVNQRKDRGTFDSVKPGKYYVYATNAAGKAVFEEVTVEDARNRLKIITLKKDPFEP